MKPAFKLLAACVLSLALCGCSPEEPQTIRLGAMYSSDIVPLVAMREREIDQKNGFLLDLQVFSSARDRDAALQSGELDCVFTDYIGACIYQNAGLDVKITGVTDGDYRLLAGEGAGVGAIKETAGRSVAVSENTLIDYTLDYLLRKNGLEPDTVVRQAAPRIPDRLELLRTGKLDLCLLPDPFATLAQEDGAVLLGSANECGLYPAVSAFTGEAIERDRELIRRFYAAYDEAAALVNQMEAAGQEQLALGGAGFPHELSGRIVLPDYRSWQLPSDGALEDAIAWSAAKGLCDASLTPSDLVCDLR